MVYLAEARVARARGVFVTDDRLITRQSESCMHSAQAFFFDHFNTIHPPAAYRGIPTR